MADWANLAQTIKNAERRHPGVHKYYGIGDANPAFGGLGYTMNSDAIGANYLSLSTVAGELGRQG